MLVGILLSLLPAALPAAFPVLPARPASAAPALRAPGGQHALSDLLVAATTRIASSCVETAESVRVGWDLLRARLAASGPGPQEPAVEVGRASSVPSAPARRTVILECPGVTCYSRFRDSLRDNLVAKHPWIHRVQIRNLTEIDPFRDPRAEIRDEKGELVWGDTVWIFFEVDAGIPDEVLTKTVLETRLYDVRGWRRVERVALR